MSSLFPMTPILLIATSFQVSDRVIPNHGTSPIQASSNVYIG